MLKTTDYYAIKTTVLLSPFSGGQFEPESGGQFEMAERGQFHLAEGGQFTWFFHIPKGKNIISGNKNIFSFPLFKSGSSYLIKIKFGNIVKTYLLDSGASDMTLDAETYQYLKGINQLKIGNNLTSREYILADGSKVEYKRVQIPTFTINNIIVNNINAVLVENGKPLLLGKSFLDSFKSWKVDNKTNTLFVETF